MKTKDIYCDPSCKGINTNYHNITLCDIFKISIISFKTQKGQTLICRPHLCTDEKLLEYNKTNAV